MQCPPSAARTHSPWCPREVCPVLHAPPSSRGPQGWGGPVLQCRGTECGRKVEVTLLSSKCESQRFAPWHKAAGCKPKGSAESLGWAASGRAWLEEKALVAPCVPRLGSVLGMLCEKDVCGSWALRGQPFFTTFLIHYTLNSLWSHISSYSAGYLWQVSVGSLQWVWWRLLSKSKQWKSVNSLA